LFFPHLGHGQKLEVWLCRLVFREDIVKVLLPALVTAVFSLNFPPLLHPPRHEICYLNLALLVYNIIVFFILTVITTLVYNILIISIRILHINLLVISDGYPLISLLSIGSCWSILKSLIILGSILLFFPHLGHGQKLEVWLCRLVFREDIVKVLLPALVTAVFSLNFPPLLHPPRHEICYLNLALLVPVFILKVFPGLQQHQSLLLLSGVPQCLVCLLVHVPRLNDPILMVILSLKLRQ